MQVIRAAGRAVRRVPGVLQMRSRANTSPHRGTLLATGSIHVFLTQNIGTRYFGRTKAGRQMYDDFRRLRGTSDLTKAIRSEEVRKRITADGAGHWFEELGSLAAGANSVPIEEIGYELGVLSQYFVEYEHVPAYKLTPFGEERLGLAVQLDPRTQYDISQNSRFAKAVADLNLTGLLQDEWKNWEKTIMLSKYGLFQVKLQQAIKMSSLHDVLAAVSALEQEFDLDVLLEGELQKFGELQRKRNVILEPSVQWEIARILIAKFLDLLNHELPVTWADGSRTRLKLRTSPWVRQAYTSGISFPHRFRYVVFELEALYRTLPNGTPVPVKLGELSDDERADIASLLEGVPIIDPGAPNAAPPPQGGQAPSPSGQPPRSGTAPSQPWLMAPVKLDRTDQLFGPAPLYEGDVATWEGEACLFTGDSALVYHEDSRELRLGRAFPMKDGRTAERTYGGYWGSVMRGVAYVCELRGATKALHNSTSDDLEQITSRYVATSRYTDLVELTYARQEKLRWSLQRDVQRAASSARLLGRLRNASRPTTMSPADYAASKFGSLREVLKMDQLMEHVDRNIRLINGILTQTYSGITQAHEQRTRRITLVFTFVLSIVTIVLPVLSFPAYYEVISGGMRFAELVNKWLEWSLAPGVVLRTLLLVLGWFVTLIAVIVGIVATLGNSHHFWDILKHSSFAQQRRRQLKYRHIVKAAPRVFGRRYRTLFEPQWRIVDFDGWALDEGRVKSVYLILYLDDEVHQSASRAWAVPDGETYDDLVHQFINETFDWELEAPFLPVLSSYQPLGLLGRLRQLGLLGGMQERALVIGYVEISSADSPGPVVRPCPPPPTHPVSFSPYRFDKKELEEIHKVVDQVRRANIEGTLRATTEGLRLV